MTIQRRVAFLMLAASLLFAVIAGFAVAFGSTDYTGVGVGGLWYYTVVLTVAFVVAALACFWIVMQPLDDDTPRNGAHYIVLFTGLLVSVFGYWAIAYGSLVIILSIAAYVAGAAILASGLKR